MLELIACLVISIIGGYVARKLHIPAPFLVGGILAVGGYSILLRLHCHFPVVKFWVQVISGTYIGSTIDRHYLAQSRKLLFPIVFLVSGMLAVNLGMGSLIHFMSGFDLLTCLMGTIPGGVTETAVIAEQFGADVSVVALLQLCRSVFSIMLFPFVIKWLLRKHRHGLEEQLHELPAPAGKVGSDESVRTKLPRLLASLSIGTIGGFLGQYVQSIPASVLVCSLLCVGVYNLSVHKAYLPMQVKRAGQVLTGVFVGTKMTYETILNLRSILLPVVMLLTGFLVFHTLLALLASRVFRMDLGTMLFSCIPAGASDVALIAGDLGCDDPGITLFQLSRLISCILLFPVVLLRFASLFS